MKLKKKLFSTTRFRNLEKELFLKESDEYKALQERIKNSPDLSNKEIRSLYGAMADKKLRTPSYKAAGAGAISSATWYAGNHLLHSTLGLKPKASLKDFALDAAIGAGIGYGINELSENFSCSQEGRRRIGRNLAEKDGYTAKPKKKQ